MKKLGFLLLVVQGLVAQAASSPCDLNSDGTVNIADVQLSVNQALGLAPCTADLDGDGRCDVVDVQRVITAALGGTCNAVSGLNPPVTVALTPPTASLTPSQLQQFTATVTGAANSGVTWSINPTLGSLVSGATTLVYVAPSTAPTTQSVTITATSMADPSKIATAVITLLQAITVSLSPSTVSLASSGTQQFTATVLGTSNTAVAWSINPLVGTISSAGLYSAPSGILTSQTVAVTAQSVADPIKSATATISFTPWRTGYFMQAEAAGQTAATIPWSKYTHVIHYALQATYTNGTCGLDPSYGNLTAASITDFVNSAHAAGVRALIGIFDNSTNAFSACTTPSNIGPFVTAISTFITANHYDGVDIDWETNIDGLQYQDLIKHLRAVMPTATLSVAVSITERHIVAAVQNDLDQINIMTYDLDKYDLAGFPINYTWYNSATLQGAAQNEAMDIYIWYYVIEAGISPSKLAVGLGFYGHVKKACLDSSGTAGVTDPNQVWFSAAPTQSIVYRDLLSSTYWSSGIHVWDEQNKSQYIRYKGGNCATDAFIPYTGPEQVQAVVSLIKEKQLGGVMTYGLPYEYLPTQTGDARYPLSTAIYQAMVGIPPVIGTTVLPDGTGGKVYSATLAATGSSPITWSISGGALPVGLLLNSTSGTVTGIPTSAGTFTFTVQATDSVASTSRTFSLTINLLPAITTTPPLPSASLGVNYSQMLSATGTNPITWSVASGALPGRTYVGRFQRHHQRHTFVCGCVYIHLDPAHSGLGWASRSLVDAGLMQFLELRDILTNG